MGDKEYIGCNMRREHCYTEIFEQIAFSREFKNFFRSNSMPGANSAFFGCSTSRKSSLSIIIILLTVHKLDVKSIAWCPSSS